MALIIRELPNDELTEIVQKSFSGSLGTEGYLSVEGCCMPRQFAEYAQPIQDMAVRKDDIFVLSFPKCGTTWTQEMVWCIANDLDYEKARRTTVHERFPFLELSGILDRRDKLRLASQELTANSRPLDSVTKVEELPSPRFIQSHLPLQLLPKHLRDQDCLAKIIYVARDPRDACISRYHFEKIVDGFTGDLHTLVKLFMAGRVAHGPFWDHVLTFWKIRHQSNVLFITYEEMKKDLKSVIRRVCQFLEKTYTEEQIDALKDHLSFEKMKKNKSVNYESIIEMKKTQGLLTEDGVFMRSGQSGQFLKDLSKGDIELLNEWCKSALKNSDYELPTH